jgi:hypothetical protein
MAMLMSINKKRKGKNIMANMGIKEEVQEEVKDLDKRMVEERQKTDGSRLGVIDLVSEKIVSRKLLVWIVSTVLLVTAKITPDEWTAISLGYVGIEGFADMAAKWRRG